MSVAKPNPHDSGPIHVSGVARYTDDIPMADPVHLAFGLSTVAHARLTSVNLDAVRAADGVHLVPKLTSDFEDIYVDIRTFSISEWKEHRSLAVALVQAEKSDLLKESASDSLQRTIDGVIEGLRQRDS